MQIFFQFFLVNFFYLANFFLRKIFMSLAKIIFSKIFL